MGDLSGRRAEEVAGGALSREDLGAPGQERSGTLRRAVSVVLEPYFYVGPGLILIALVMIVPLIVGIGYSFQNVQILNPFKTGWVGLQHYRTLAARPGLLARAGQHCLVDLRLARPSSSCLAWAWRCS